MQNILLNVFENSGKWNPDSVTVDELVRSLVLAVEIEACHGPSQIHGIAAIVDLRGLSVSVLLNHLKPAVVRKIVSCFQVLLFVAFLARESKFRASYLQGTFPMRLKAVHVVQESTLMDVFITLRKPFLNDKIRQRVSCEFF